MVDLSGNETVWEFTDGLEDGPVLTLANSVDFMSAWSDPTIKTDALGRTVEYRYSDNFRVMEEVIDVYGTISSYTVDELGRRIDMTVVDSDGVTLREEVYAFEDPNFPLFMTRKTVQVYENISGQAWEVPLVTQFVPDSRGRLLQEIEDPDALALTTTHSYDLNNNKVSTQDARGNTTSFVYDTLNRLTDVIYPVAGTSTGERIATKQIRYDANGNQAVTIDEEGNQIFYLHDALNRTVQTIVDLEPSAANEDTVYPVPNSNGIIPENSRGIAGSTDLVLSLIHI